MKEAIVLAGGFGTRLRSVVQDLPKPMAPVGDRPFLCYLLQRLAQQGYSHAVLSTGYMHEKVAQYFGHSYLSLSIDYAVEHEPLGTGGGIRNALELCTEDRITVLNGDTLFDIDHSSFISQADTSDCPIALATRHVADASRYGQVISDSAGHVLAFREKETIAKEGYINGGIYRLQRTLLERYAVGKSFSFERDVMQPLLFPTLAVGYDSYFIDIGIPADYARAQQELPLL